MVYHCRCARIALHIWTWCAENQRGYPRKWGLLAETAEMNTLILVESPTKARTISQYVRGLLDGAVLVRSTGGHLRDLPEDRLGVDVQNGFAPQYEIRLARTVAMLRPLIAQAGRVILATDPDREGEAIAWHITKIFERELMGKEVQRVTFRSITREAVVEGLRHPRRIDTDLVLAAVARRVIDRLIGYHVSPRLWSAMKKHGKDFSAGRVQMAALALLREAEEAWQVSVEWGA